jgi:SHS2 domain-containing protein
MPADIRRIRWGSFPTTADVGLWARAPTPAGLFEGLGHALIARGTDPPALVVDFLTRLLDLEQDDGFLARTLAVRIGDDAVTRLTAEARGERFDASRHPRRIEVKAVTLHRLVFDPARGRARVILDI